MMVHTAQQHGASLREPSCPACHFGDAVYNLRRHMVAVMRAHNGIGLAAIQVGVAVRCFVMLDPRREAAPLFAANPVVTWRSTAMQIVDEGCLSVPGVTVPMVRHAALSMDYLDERGVARTGQFSGLAAAIVQHELDHLDGVLIGDRAESA